MRNETANRVVLSPREGKGIRIDTGNPSYCWRDLEGVESVDITGQNSATLRSYRGKIREYAFGVSDMKDARFHMPHDYVPKSDMYLHIHWSHNGSTISGAVGATAAYTYARGHDQEIFAPEKQILFSHSTPNIATIPAFQHFITEIPITADVATASLMSNALLEPDGLLLLNLEITAVPTLSGGKHLFVHRTDLHYLSTNIGTLNKAPYFYGH